VLATSDVPVGVVNLLTGFTAELAPWLAGHRDVNALDLTGAAGASESDQPDSGGWLDDTELEAPDEMPAPWDTEPMPATAASQAAPGSVVGLDDDEIGRLDLAKAAAEASAALGGGGDEDDSDSVPAGSSPVDDGDWAATVQSEVKVESPRRRRRPWWRPGD